MEETNEDNLLGGSGQEVISTLFLSKSYLAAATFQADENVIWLDCFSCSMSEAEYLLEFLKVVSETTLFLLSPGVVTNSAFLGAVRRGVDGAENVYEFKTLKSVCWSESYAREMINGTLRLTASRSSDLDNLAKISTSCDVDRVECMQCLGALIHYLSKSVFNLDKDVVSIRQVLPFPVDCYLRMDENTFSALQVFKEDVHPNWIRGKGRSKEGFSLFGIFDRTATSIGHRKLREWMSKPFNDMERILARQAEIETLLRDEVRDTVIDLSKQLKLVSDIPLLLRKIKKAEAKAKEWCKFTRSIKQAAQIMATYNRIREEQGLDHNVIVTLCQIAECIENVLDLRQCESENSFVIQDGYDLELDAKKFLYDSLEEHLVSAAHELLAAVPQLTDLVVEYIPQAGFYAVVDVANWHELKNHGLVNENSSSRETNPSRSSYQEAVAALSSENRSSNSADSNRFALQFSRDDRFYLTHPIVLKLDNDIGDIRSDLTDRQRECIIGLEDIVAEYEHEVYLMSNEIGNLDALISFAEIAREGNMVKPIISDEVILAVKNGRHLLQELTVDAFIPNDTFAAQPKSISLITGPNGSGKSIYLKQVGLLTYLAHIGSWVPCEKAVIGLTDRIFTRIRSEESVSRSQSAFTVDLCQMSKMFTRRTERSLCLIDEFGKGTMPADGMALLAAALNHMAEEVRCRVFCVLHFTEIFEQELLTPAALQAINFFCMETVSESGQDGGQEAGGVHDKVIPMYRLKYGSDHSASGIECAEGVGMAKHVLQRAEAIKEAIVNRKEVVKCDEEILRAVAMNHSTLLTAVFEVNDQ